MCPYIAFEHRQQRYKSEADSDGHTEPAWNQEVDVPIYSLDEEVKIECLDLGIIYDELISSTVMKISDIYQNHNSEIDVSLQYKGKAAGHLYLYCFVNRQKSKIFYDLGKHRSPKVDHKEQDHSKKITKTQVQAKVKEK